MLIGDQRFRALLYGTAASLMFALMGAVVHAAAKDTNNEMLVFLRNLFGLLILLPLLGRYGQSAARTQRFSLHLLRGLFGLAAMYCFFYTLARMQLAQAVLLNFSAPLFIPIFAAIWLKEPAPLSVLAAIAVGFIGVTLILNPSVEGTGPVAFVGLASAMFAALAMVSIRGLSGTEPSYVIVFYFALIGSLVSAVPLLWAWQTPSVKTTWLMALAGLFATKGQLCLTRSYALAPAAARAGSASFCAVIFAAAIGWGLWDQRPNLSTIIGSIIVFSAAALAMGAGTKPVPLTVADGQPPDRVI